MEEEFLRQLAENMEKLLVQGSPTEDAPIPSIEDLKAAFQELSAEGTSSLEASNLEPKSGDTQETFQDQIAKTMDKLRESSEKVDVCKSSCW